ncbi:MAG: rod shape-determining protein MreC [bacterium]|nr:rod shape-determining protein MreC [bacterium]
MGHFFLKKYSASIGVGLLLLLIGGNVFFGTIRDFLSQTSLPIQLFLWQSGASVSRFSEGLLYPSALSKETQDLRNEQTLLLSELLTLRDIKREHEQLLEAIDLGMFEEFTLQNVKMVGVVPGGDAIIIGWGREDGARPDMVVVTSGNVFVGIIKEVFAQTSLVFLSSHQQFSLSARVAEKNAIGVVQGRGRGQVSIEFLPPDAFIEVGDIVVTNETKGAFPSNLLVGVVEETERVSVESFQRSRIRSLFSPHWSELLFIVME